MAIEPPSAGPVFLSGNRRNRWYVIIGSMRLRWMLVVWLFAILFPVAMFRQFWPAFRRQFDAIFYPDWIHVLVHIILFAGFTLLLSWNYRIALTPARAAGVLLAALGVGILQEALQALSQQIFWLPGVLFDLGIDLAGGILGLLIWRLFGAKITGSRQAPD